MARHSIPSYLSIRVMCIEENGKIMKKFELDISGVFLMTAANVYVLIPSYVRYLRYHSTSANFYDRNLR